MLSLDGYTPSKRLYAGTHSEVHVAVRRRDGRELLLKSYLAPEPARAWARAEREFEAMRRLAGPGVVAALELLRVAEQPVLVLERAPGVPLGEWVQAALPPVGHWLEVAIQLCDVLSRVHAERLIHADIHPGHVLVDPKTLQVHLIGFELTRALGSALRGADSRLEAGGLAGTLQFMAPEATGRMNRGIDARSDLYSLGATLYFALVGRPPFESDDALTLIHSHIAKVPIPPAQLRPHVPGTLSRIASKLLQKSPEDRYQTVAALGLDLRECREQLNRAGTIQEELPLATADAPHRPLFTRRLYGRDAEVLQLQQSYASAARGEPALLLLVGPPGVGKSELVHALRTPLVESGGYLALGKFDQYRRDLPYAGFTRAFASLVQQILTESDARLARWQSELRQGLGAIAGALSGIVPELRFLLGEVAPVPLLGPAEMRARLALAVRSLTAACATPEHPLVLCLDDLQWADAASLHLLRDLLLGGGGGEALLVLGSYRDSEVDAAHPLSALLAELRRNEVKVDALTVTPLSEEASAEMLAEALGRSRSETRSLAASVARKTGNAPLLIQQFIYHVYDLGLVRFQVGMGWTWDEAEIAGASIPDDVVGLLTAKIGRLAEPVAAVLELASCVGDSFDLQTLAELSERLREQIETALFTLCDAGFIAPSPQGFRFAHDRIREAAHGLLSAQERAELHAKAARLLLERTPHEDLSERAFEIADHLLLAPEPTDDAERRRALEIHVSAGKRALISGAAVTASHYFAAARALFRAEQWDTELQLGFDLFTQSADALYQVRDFAGVLALLDAADRPRLGVLQAAQIEAKRIATHVAASEPARQMAVLLAGLRRFGIHVTANPPLWRAGLAVWATQRALRRPLDERGFPERRVRDRALWLAQLLVVAAAAPAAAVHSPSLFVVLMSIQLRSRCRHGSSPGLGLSLAAWAALVAGRFADAGDCERFAQAALDWSERSKKPSDLAKTEYVLQAWVYPFIRPRRSALEPLREIADRCFQLGELEYGFYALLLLHVRMSLAGENLDEVGRHHAAITRRMRGTVLLDLTAGHGDMLAWLRQAAEPGVDVPTPAQLAAVMEHLRHPVARFGPWATFAMSLGLLGRFEDLLRGLDLAPPYQGAATVYVTFFHGVAAAELAGSATPARRRRGLRGRLRRCARQMNRWAKQNSDFEHMARALYAERARVRGRTAFALAQYALAIERAASCGYRHHAAFLLERRGLLLLSQRRRLEATLDFRRSKELYAEWGAHVKVAALDARVASAEAQGRR